MAKKSGRLRAPPKRGYKPTRPIVSLRLDPRIYADVKAEADARGLTLTDVIQQRLLRFEMLHDLQNISAINNAAEDAAEIDAELQSHPELKGDREAAWRQLEKRGLEAGLEMSGYTRLVISGGGGVLWADPEARVPASIVKVLTEPKE
jgi:putative NADH-flavin reductase